MIILRHLSLVLAIVSASLLYATDPYWHFTFPSAPGSLVMTRVNWQRATEGPDLLFNGSKIAEALHRFFTSHPTEQMADYKLIEVDSQQSHDIEKIMTYRGCEEALKNEHDAFMSKHGREIEPWYLLFKTQEGAILGQWLDQIFYNKKTRDLIFDSIDRFQTSLDTFNQLCEQYKDDNGFIVFCSFIRSKQVPAPLLKEFFILTFTISARVEELQKQYGVFELSKGIASGEITNLYLLNK